MKIRGYSRKGVLGHCKYDSIFYKNLKNWGKSRVLYEYVGKCKKDNI